MTTVIYEQWIIVWIQSEVEVASQVYHWRDVESRHRSDFFRPWYWYLDFQYQPIRRSVLIPWVYLISCKTHCVEVIIPLCVRQPQASLKHHFTNIVIQNVTNTIIDTNYYYYYYVLKQWYPIWTYCHRYPIQQFESLWDWYLISMSVLVHHQHS